MNLINSIQYWLQIRRMKKNWHTILDKECELIGTDLDAIITIIRKASDQQIKRDSAIAIASRAILTGVATTLREFERVVSIATRWAYHIGSDVEQCVNMFMTTAVKQSRRLAASQLGLVVKVRPSTGFSPGARIQMFLDDMIKATGWDYARR